MISHVAFTNIVATHISSWGLQMADLQNDDVQANNLTVLRRGQWHTDRCLQTEGNQVNFANVYCTDIGTYGLYDNKTIRLTGTEFPFQRREPGEWDAGSFT